MLKKTKKNGIGSGLLVVGIDFLESIIDYINFCFLNQFRLKSNEEFKKINITKWNTHLMPGIH